MSNDSDFSDVEDDEYVDFEALAVDMRRQLGPQKSLKNL